MNLKGSVTAKRNGKGFDKIVKSSKTSIFSKLQLCAIELHAEAVKGIMKRSMGNPYKYKGKERIAGKIGEPPNVQTGVFVRSVQFETDFDSLTAVVGTNDIRGPWFEFGTKYYSPWHPWLESAWKKVQSRFKKILSQLKLEAE